MSDLKDILNSNNEDISQNELTDYLNGKLSNEEAHAIEMKLDEDDAFEHDAIEGLQEHKGNLETVLFNINHKIDKRLKNNKNKFHKPDKKLLQLNAVTVWVILGLIVVGFIVLRYLKK